MNIVHLTRAVGAEGFWGLLAPPILGRSANPMSIKGGGGHIMPTTLLDPPEFSDLPTNVITLYLATLNFCSSLGRHRRRDTLRTSDCDLVKKNIKLIL